MPCATKRCLQSKCYCQIMLSSHVAHAVKEDDGSLVAFERVGAETSLQTRPKLMPHLSARHMHLEHQNSLRCRGSQCTCCVLTAHVDRALCDEARRRERWLRKASLAIWSPCTTVCMPEALTGQPRCNVACAHASIDSHAMQQL